TPGSFAIGSDPERIERAPSRPNRGVHRCPPQPGDMYGPTPGARCKTRMMAPRTAPPFRADHVGSYLRTPAIHEARARRDAGDLDADELRAIEDREIADLI